MSATAMTAAARIGPGLVRFVCSFSAIMMQTLTFMSSLDSGWRQVNAYLYGVDLFRDSE